MEAYAIADSIEGVRKYLDNLYQGRRIIAIDINKDKLVESTMWEIYPDVDWRHHRYELGREDMTFLVSEDCCITEGVFAGDVHTPVEVAMDICVESVLEDGLYEGILDDEILLSTDELEIQSVIITEHVVILDITDKNK